MPSTGAARKRLSPPTRASEGHGPASPAPHAFAHADAAVVGRLASPVLRTAVGNIADSWAKSLRGGVSREEVLEGLTDLASTVEGLAAGSVTAEDVALRQCPLSRQLAELLRQELLAPSDADPRPDPAHVLDLLRAAEDLRARLDAPAGEGLDGRLRQPDAFELIVEVAHDLRSPLTSILFLSETLRRGHSGEVNEVQHRQLGLVYSAALGLISIASDIMELARGGKRLSDEDPQRFSVGEILESIREMVQIMADEKSITLRLLEPEGDRVLGYPVALSRALLNLTTNALKFTDEGLVEVTAQRLNRRDVMFSVRDTGRGISEEAQATLFEPFQKARARSGHYFSGSGLGLSIARRLVEAMGSELRFETRPDWGTRFFFTVPLPTADEI